MKEKDLVNILNDYIESKKIIYGNEIRMGIGIPDIMICSEMLKKESLITDYYALKIYDYINKKKVDNIEEITKKVSMSKKNICKYIYELKEKNILEFEKDKIEVLKDLDLQDIGTNISIEVKLKDWKNGILQAKRYLRFSDYSYLAILEQYQKNIDLDELKNSGIGLIVVGDKIKQVIKPKKSKQCDKYFKYISISSLLNKRNIDDNIEFNSNNLLSIW